MRAATLRCGHLLWTAASVAEQATTVLTGELRLHGQTGNGLHGGIGLHPPPAASPGGIVAGLRHPRVLVSESTVALLTPDELRMALKHEHEHMKSRDNLKRLILAFCPFPGMAKLENAWSQASELAADDAAVSSQRDALDLAAALVKLSRLVPKASPVCSAGFVAGSVSERVAYLLDWDETSKSRRVHIRTWFVIPFAVALALLLSIAHRPVLAITHEATEWVMIR